MFDPVFKRGGSVNTHLRRARNRVPGGAGFDPGEGRSGRTVAHGGALREMKQALR